MRFGFPAGVLLALLGLMFMALVAMGTGLGPSGMDKSLYGVDARAALTIAAGLCLAVGVTLVGLGFGHWRRPVPPGPTLDHTPDRRQQP
jgi:drug/metabolite transporter (DMT)-like permease